jgi:DNA-binding NarL/FixJ family response regulator
MGQPEPEKPGGHAVAADSDIHVLVVSEHLLVRWGVRAALTDPTLRVVGEAEDATEALASADRLRPHVVVTELGSAGSLATVVELGEQIRFVGPGGRQCGLLVLVDTGQSALLRRLPPDISWIHLRDATPAKLTATVRMAAAGYVLLPRAPDEPAAGALGTAAATPRHGGLPVTVTQREREVLSLVVEGLNNTEIAGKLSIGESTVKSHVQHLITKLGLRDRAQLIVYAYRSGLDTALARDGGRPTW